MAKVQVQVTGGAIRELQANTIAEVKAALNIKSYSAQVNGDPQQDSFQLKDYQFITLTESVKGGV